MLDLLSLYGREANQKNNWRLDFTIQSIQLQDEQKMFLLPQLWSLLSQPLAQHTMALT